MIMVSGMWTDAMYVIILEYPGPLVCAPPSSPVHDNLYRCGGRISEPVILAAIEWMKMELSQLHLFPMLYVLS